jgi:hypothetical protein
VANRSLGVIAVTPGTPIRLTANETTPALSVWAHAYMVEGWGATGGDGYVGQFKTNLDGTRPALNKATGAGCFGRIPQSTATLYNYFQSTVEITTSVFDMSLIAIDGDVSGSYLISILEA